MLAALIPAVALVALIGLCAVAPSDVPRIPGAVALLITLAALAVAILR